MNIQFEAIHFSLDKKLKDFIKKKVNKLILIDDTIINTDIYLKVERAESYDNKVVEIRIHSSEGVFFAKKQSNTFEESADLTVQALRKQMIKHKEK
tara:strand:- start:170 stop:457 length:288 start_codon:yes stop_codon:yes gene_type:complete